MTTSRVLSMISARAMVSLYKQYEFNDFMGPMNLANKIAILAEQEAHHPDLTITCGMCKVEIWTHKINGLTESDFILAAKIESRIDPINAQ